MMEIALVQSFLDRDIYNKYKQYTHNLVLNKEIADLLRTIDSFYEEYPEQRTISVTELSTYHEYLNPAQRNKMAVDAIFQSLATPVSKLLIQDILKSLLEREFASRIVQKLTPVLTGERFGLLRDVRVLLDEYEEIAELKHPEDSSPIVNLDICNALNEIATTHGLQWPIRGLQEDLGDLRGAVLGHVFARSNVGKTTFILGLMTSWALQIQHGECGIWFNNEEDRKRLQIRLASSVCNATEEKMLLSPQKAFDVFKKRLQDRIVFYDDGKITVSDIRRTLATHNVKWAVIDSGDEVHFSKMFNYPRPERLGTLYRMYRQLCKEFQIPILTTGQASIEASGQAVLHANHMADSKTDKIKSLDYCLGIGISNEPGKEDIRYIHIVKSKLHHGVQGLHAVRIKPEVGRYEDL